jgi:hypothetical protein
VNYKVRFECYLCELRSEEVIQINLVSFSKAKI